LEHIQAMIAHGYENQILLSHDRGWYDPSKPHGGTPDPFTYLPETFLPKMRVAGIGERVIWKLMRDNPFSAFSRGL